LQLQVQLQIFVEQRSDCQQKAAAAAKAPPNLAEAQRRARELAQQLAIKQVHFHFHFHFCRLFSLSQAARMLDTGPKNHFEAEVEINDYPQQVRWKVTHKEQIQQIVEWTGAGITTKVLRRSLSLSFLNLCGCLPDDCFREHIFHPANSRLRVSGSCIYSSRLPPRPPSSAPRPNSRYTHAERAKERERDPFYSYACAYVSQRLIEEALISAAQSAHAFAQPTGRYSVV
jgi:hypothetical protein